MNPFIGFKILQHVNAIADWQAGQSHPPIQVELDLSNACQSACPWCAGYPNRPSTKFLLYGGNISRVYDLILEISDMGTKSITFTGGGEPSTFQGWEKALMFAHECGMQVGLFTNGFNSVEAVTHCCTFIRFSVDASNEVDYGRQHGRPYHFSRVVQNVIRALQNKQSCTIGVGFVTSAQQCHDIVPFTKLWHDVPIDYIQYRPLQDYNGVHWQSDDAATAAEIAKAKELDPRVVYSDLKYLAVSGIHRELNGRTEKCYGVMFATSISADGKVYVCCHLKGNPAGAIGDLYIEPFSDIWHRHCQKQCVQVIPACPSLCRHYLTNVCITEHIVKPATHPNFI